MRARQTDRYEGALGALAEHASLSDFSGTAGLIAWERLNVLVAQLRAAYDAYELEGDVAPVRQAIERYMSDMHAMHQRPSLWITAHLAGLLDALEADLPVITIDTHVATPVLTVTWPSELLSISPEELEALHALLHSRTPPTLLPPSA